MNPWHCLDCGTPLKEISHTLSCDKYYCETCKVNWFRNVRVIVEWKSQGMEEVKHPAALADLVGTMQRLSSKEG